MTYYIRITANAYQGPVDFPLVLDADGFDDDGDWSIVGRYFSIKEGYWRVPAGLTSFIFLDNKKDTTWDAIANNAQPWTVATLDIPRFPLQVGDSGGGHVFWERMRSLNDGNLKWTVASRV
jgi:hypothetical protein